jgi:YidC/Oxa1 family membrane protein insertase
MSFTPTPFRDDGRAKVGDWGNILLFVVLTLALGYLFDLYVMKPREAVMMAHEKAQTAQYQDLLLNDELTPPPRSYGVVAGETTRLSLSNAEITATVNTLRGRLDDVALKNYFTTLEKTDPVRVLAPAGTDHPTVSETGWISADKKLVLPGPRTVWQTLPSTDPKQIVLGWNNGQGLIFTRTFTLDEHFLITVQDRVENKGAAAVTLYPYGSLTQHGLPADLHPGIVHEGAIGYVGEEYLSQTYSGWENKAAKPTTTTASTGWLGITGRYFYAGLIPPQGQETQYRITYRPQGNTLDPYARPRYQVDVQGAAIAVQPGQATEYTQNIFAGAKKLRLIEDYETRLGLVHFDLVVDFGWFYFLTKPFYYALVYLNDWVGNFGVAILLLTLFLRIAVFPLANTSFKSFAKMKKVSPQIQELQKTYAGDKKKMQEELVKLYTKEKVNPVSGCLPILAQIPIFFAMYKVISVAIEMRHAPFFGWIQDLTAPDPTSIFNLFGLLPFDVHSWLHFGIWPCVLLVCIMIQVRLSPPPTDKMMLVFFNYYYPVLVSFIMAKFAAGLVIYWAFSAFLSIAQQIIIMRSMDVPVHLFERFKKEKTDGT